MNGKMWVWCVGLVLVAAAAQASGAVYNFGDIAAEPKQAVTAEHPVDYSMADQIVGQSGTDWVGTSPYDLAPVPDKAVACTDCGCAASQAATTASALETKPEAATAEPTATTEWVMVQDCSSGSCSYQLMPVTTSTALGTTMTATEPRSFRVFNGRVRQRLFGGRLFGGRVLGRLFGGCR